MPNEQELNKKLAEWAGFKFSYRNRVKNFVTGVLGGFVEFWLRPDGDVGRLPNFTQSLDTCFKWLVPKSWMDTLWIINNLDSPTPQIEYCFGFLRGKDNDLICWSKDLPVEDCLSPTAETTALAICLAIEKLIDGEVKANA